MGLGISMDLGCETLPPTSLGGWSSPGTMQLRFPLLRHSKAFPRLSSWWALLVGPGLGSQHSCSTTNSGECRPGVLHFQN